jgi:proteasome lid subunit RPN8/RPN11
MIATDAWDDLTTFDLQPQKRSLPQAEPADFPAYVLDEATDFTLYITDLALIKMREYICQDPDKEIGGVLLGQHFKRGERTVVVVNEPLALPSHSTSRLHFAFDAHALLTLHHLAPRTADKYLVGWFHSHVRIGDPFMSPPDIELHRDHFREPWYVSCVVSNGEWTLPVGFWRMLGNQLLPINEHYVHMTPAVSLAEQTRRYFRSCITDERPQDQLRSRIAAILPSIGIDGSTPLSAIVGKTAEATKSLIGKHSLSTLSLLTVLATAMVDNPKVRSEVQELERILQQAATQETADEIVPYGSAEVVAASADHILYIADNVLIGIREHVGSQPDSYTGGVLLGQHYTHHGRTVVLVSEHLPLSNHNTTGSHFDFDATLLSKLRQRTESEFSLSFVGWFYSRIRPGEPCMSSAGLEVHKRHFQEPWALSCVVGAGERALPVSFWYLRGATIVPVREHYVHMTPLPAATNDVGEQTRRYFRACLSEETPVHRLLSHPTTLLPQIGVTPEYYLDNYVLPVVEEEKKRSTFINTRDSLQKILELATTLATQSDDLRVVRHLDHQLQHISFQEEAFRAILASTFLQSRMAIWGNQCFSLKPGNLKLYCCHFVKKTIWPIHLAHVLPLADVAYASDGKLWLLTQQGRIICFANLSSDESSLSHETLSPVICEAIQLPSQLDMKPLELLIRNQTVWVRTMRQVLKFTILREAHSYEVPVDLFSTTELLGQSCTFLRGVNESEDLLISTASGVLQKWDIQFKQVAEAPLPTPWQHWTLHQACQCKAGLLLLFTEGATTHLGLFNPRTLALETHYLQDRPADKSVPLFALTSDGMGRAYIKKGHTLFLLSESGAPNPQWYDTRFRVVEINNPL